MCVLIVICFIFGIYLISNAFNGFAFVLTRKKYQKKFHEDSPIFVILDPSLKSDVVKTKFKKSLFLFFLGLVFVAFSVCYIKNRISQDLACYVIFGLMLGMAIIMIYNAIVNGYESCKRRFENAHGELLNHYADDSY